MAWRLDRVFQANSWHAGLARAGANMPANSGRAGFADGSCKYWNLLRQHVAKRFSAVRTKWRLGSQVLAVTIAVMFLVSSGSTRMGVSSNLGQFKLMEGGDCSILPTGQVAAEVNQAYDYYSNDTTVNVGGWTPQSTVDTEVDNAFQTVCTLPGFEGQVGNWTAANFSLEIQAFGTGIQWTNFTFTWANWTSGHNGSLYGNTEWWPLNIPSNTLTRAAKLISSGDNTNYGCCAKSMNWAGWEFYQSSTPDIEVTQDMTKVIGFSTPATGSQSNVPSGVAIDPVAAVWTGMSPAAGGGGDIVYNGHALPTLLQDGYTLDAYNPSRGGCANFALTSCDDGLWWEFTGANETYSPAFSYTGEPTFYTGQLVYQAVTLTDQFAATSVWTAWESSLAPGSPGYWAHSVTTCLCWYAEYAQRMVETPTMPSPYTSVVQQFPILNSYDQRFEYGFTDTATGGVAGVPDTTAYAAGDFNIYQLCQSHDIWGNPQWSSSQNFVTGTDFYAYSTHWQWPQVGWITSKYDYAVVVLGC